jgi:putative Mg2+ transporter-C (MgtC) family protein
VEILSTILGDVRQLVPAPYASILLVGVSFLCGGMVGFEREREHKPAGLRTIILICVGSTIFTLVSASPALAAKEPARIAAQIVTGVGFLGAGSIMRDRHQVTGLTTAATIWATAGIGIAVGAGYALAGIALAACVLLTLNGVRRLEGLLLGPCALRRVRVVHQTASGKIRARIQAALDASRGPVRAGAERDRPDGMHEIEVTYCTVHRDHRAVLAQLAEVPGVEALETTE